MFNSAPRTAPREPPPVSVSIVIFNPIPEVSDETPSWKAELTTSTGSGLSDDRSASQGGTAFKGEAEQNHQNVSLTQLFHHLWRRFKLWTCVIKFTPGIIYLSHITFHCCVRGDSWKCRQDGGDHVARVRAQEQGRETKFRAWKSISEDQHAAAAGQKTQAAALLGPPTVSVMETCGTPMLTSNE